MDIDMIVDFSQSILHPFQSLQLSASSLDFGLEFASNKTPRQLAEDINRIIKLHEAHKIEMFRLYFGPSEIFVSDIDNWIAFAVAKGVQVLELDFSMGSDLSDKSVDEATEYRLPDFLYRCNSITRLRLKHCKFHPPSDFFSFPALQSLSLNYVDIRDHVLETMIANSPRLASLSMANLFPDGSIKVIGKELRRLAIIGGWFGGIEIFAPKLQSFIFNSQYCFGSRFCSSKSSNVSVPTLEDAFFISSTGLEPDYDLILLVSYIRHVKILTICSATQMAFNYPDELLPLSLPNLRELQLLVDYVDKFYYENISAFLKFCHCPVLEKLYIRVLAIPKEMSDELQDIQESAGVVFSRLKVIKMTNFVGTKSEMSLVGFLLQRAVCLENLVLVAPNAFESIRGLNGAAEEASPGLNTSFMSLQHQISVLPKASPRANVILVKFEEDELTFAATHQENYDE